MSQPGWLVLRYQNHHLRSFDMLKCISYSYLLIIYTVYLNLGNLISRHREGSILEKYACCEEQEENSLDEEVARGSGRWHHLVSFDGSRQLLPSQRSLRLSFSSHQLGI